MQFLTSMSDWAVSGLSVRFPVMNSYFLSSRLTLSHDYVILDMKFKIGSMNCTVSGRKPRTIVQDLGKRSACDLEKFYK